MTLTHINPRDYDVFVALDVDRKSYAISFKRSGMQDPKSIKMPADPHRLHNYFTRRFPNDKVVYAYETGPTGYKLHDHLKQLGSSCIMAHPGNIRKAPKDRVKTNRLDSIKLLKDLSSGDLPGIRVPDEAYRQLRHITSTRQHYANDLRRAKQRIESFLLFESIILPELIATRWSNKHIGLLKNLKLDQVRQFKMASFLSDLEYSRQRLLAVHKELQMFLKQNKTLESHIQLLKTLPGFGVVVSAYFLARIGNPENLRNVREIGSFIGLVPTEHSTGDTTNRGHITHMGDPVLRGLLVEAGWVAIRRDKELKQFYERIRSKNPGFRGPKVAIVAVARKLTHRAHRVLKDQRPYEFR